MAINPLRYIARVVIEFTSSFIIGGEYDFFADDAFIADINGLPLIPGTSIAGVLRHEYEKRRGESKTARIFGWQRGNEGAGSRLSVSCGCIHNQENRPVEGTLREDALRNDPVLSQALQSQIREHVRICHTGTAADTGKFDEKCVSAGHRFTFELLLEGDKNDETAWNDLLNILTLSTMRLGGKTRRGFGSFDVVQIKRNVFDLATTSGFKGFCAHPASLAAPVQGGEEPKRSQDALKATIRLDPEGFWMFGGGSGSSDADMHPVSEQRIVWTSNNGRGPGSVAGNKFYIPGSSIKGAISHRTAFHYNARNGIFADGKSGQKLAEIAENNQAVRELFGYCKSDDKESPGQRGRILIKDVFVDTDTQKIVNHVSIDRFTGGARAGFLFAENPLYQGNRITLELAVVEPESIGPEARNALKGALDDLVKGRLPLGAGAGRGNGFFTGKVDWNDNGAWIGGGA